MADFKIELPTIRTAAAVSSAKGLSEIVAKTVKTADDLTKQVRVLQKDQMHIGRSLHILQSIQRTKTTVQQLDALLKKSLATPLKRAELEEACALAKRYLDLDCIDEIKEIYKRLALQGPLVAPSSAPNVMDTLLATSPSDEMQTLVDSLTDIIMVAFDDAAASGSPQEITAIFKLFPMIKKTDLGLDKLSAYVCGIVSSNVNQGLKKALESKNKSTYLDCLVLLFEAVASMIDRQEQMVEYYYGTGAMLVVIQRLQREADIQSGILLNSLGDARQLDRKVAEINRIQEQKRKNKPVPDDNIDARELDMILDELATLCNKAQLFERFIRLRAEGEVAKIKQAISNGSKAQEAGDSRRLSSIGSPAPDAGHMPVPISDTVLALALPESAQIIPSATKLSEKIHTLVNHFVILGDYFVQKSIVKAISLDTPDPDSLTTSMVDDVFYLLKTTIQRGMATKDPDCFCALINSVARTLEEDYMALLLSKLSSMFTSAATSDEAKAVGLAPILNNIDTSCTYINQLCGQVEQELDQVFSHCSPLAREQIKSCLSNLTDYSAKTRQILKTWIENYYNQTIRPKIRNMVGALVLDAKYVLTEDEYGAWEATHARAIPQKFHSQFQRLVAPHEKTLTEQNQSHLITLILSGMLKEWEGRLLQIKFGFLGALRLDKEVRDTLTLCIPHSPLSRDLFSRLTQICLVMGVEQPEEVLEVWGGRSGAIRWRLSALDVKKILATRVEFSASAVAALSL
ncbi:Golgi transport complex subunit 4 [Kappamyces sp. JEL0829]|nr:Golgi transport complex subunit 4 [Kappamyces sp. JEL0829]